MHTLTTADKVAMYLGGGLVLFGTFGIGLLDMLFGAGHPVSGEGEIVHEAVIPLEVRSVVIISGLIVWGLYAVYKILATQPATAQRV